MFLTHELTPVSNDNLNRTVRENHSRAGLYSSDFRPLGRAESTPLASVAMLCCAHEVIDAIDRDSDGRHDERILGHRLVTSVTSG